MCQRLLWLCSNPWLATSPFLALLYCCILWGPPPPMLISWANPSEFKHYLFIPPLSSISSLSCELMCVCMSLCVHLIWEPGGCKVQRVKLFDTHTLTQRRTLLEIQQLQRLKQSNSSPEWMTFTLPTSKNTYTLLCFWKRWNYFRQPKNKSWEIKS